MSPRTIFRIHYERIQKRLSQKELARRARMRQQDLSLMEQGRYLPTPDELFRLSQVLLITPPEVLLKPTVLREEDVAEPARG